MSDNQEGRRALLSIAQHIVDKRLRETKGALTTLEARNVSSHCGLSHDDAERALRVLVEERPGLNFNLIAECPNCTDGSQWKLFEGATFPLTRDCDYCGMEAGLEEEDFCIRLSLSDLTLALYPLRDKATGLSDALTRQGLSELAERARAISDELHTMALAAKP